MKLFWIAAMKPIHCVGRWKLWWLFSFSQDHRKDYNLTTDENIFVVVAWAYAGDLRLLKFSPSEVKVYDTSHTNNENCPHMTITGQTSSGHAFTWMRVICYQKCLESHWTDVIISDSDSQEISWLDNAIHDCFPHFQRLQCGGHIVENRWQKHCSDEYSVRAPIRNQFKQLLKVVKNGFILGWSQVTVKQKLNTTFLRYYWCTHYLSSDPVLSI